MGYTHYWRTKPKLPKKRLQDAISDCSVVINAVKDEGITIRGWDGTGEPELGEDYISFNGDGEDSVDLAHETFRFPIDAEKEKAMGLGLDEDGRIFDFCKTAGKPYDLAVTACLIVLRLYLGNAVWVSSDGNMSGEEWEPGKQLVRRLIGQDKISPPSTKVLAALLDGEI